MVNKQKPAQYILCRLFLLNPEKCIRNLKENELYKIPYKSDKSMVNKGF